MPAGPGAAPPSGDDLVQPFMLESSGIRGNLVRLGSVAEAIITGHGYPQPVGELLGELLALTGVLSSMLKFDGVFALQAKGDGPVGMMVADMTSQRRLRAYAGFDADKLTAVLRARRRARIRDRPGVPELLGSGYLACTVDEGVATERHQGIVELDGPSLADCLQHYFRQCEQIQTGLVVAAGKPDGAWRAAGLILQRLPKSDQGSPGKAKPAYEDAWLRAMVLQASCTEAELLDPKLPVHDLLYRLFHEEGVRVFRQRALVAGCRCTRERLEETLRAMPRERVEDLTIDGEVVVTCQFCNRDYRFDWAALERIYAP
ncbi:MAG: Hsp33 family molecular chaperone HslO [Kiloniellaceae bacterium]